VACPPPFLRMIDHGIADGDRFSRLTSVQYQLAIAALQPDAAYDVSGVGNVAPAVRALMGKIKVSADESLMPGFPAAWQAAVRVHIGEKVTQKKVTQIPGDPGRPFGEREVTGKFHALADGLIGASRVEQLIAATRRMLDGGMTPAHLLTAIGDAAAGSIAR
jgi:2-methylcitrate dehydratase PrpD